MKRLFLTFGALIIMVVAFAQEAPLAKREIQVNAKIGFASNYGLPIYLGIDYAVNKDITVGTELSYREYNDNWGDTLSLKEHYSVVGIYVNGNYHFNTLLNINNNWDFYTGLHLGLNIYKSSNVYGPLLNSGLGAQIGGRYYWNYRWGINLEAEIGGPFFGGKVGITYKL